MPCTNFHENRSTIVTCENLVSLWTFPKMAGKFGGKNWCHGGCWTQPEERIQRTWFFCFKPKCSHRYKPKHKFAYYSAPWWPNDTKFVVFIQNVILYHMTKFGNDFVKALPRYKLTSCLVVFPLNWIGWCEKLDRAIIGTYQTLIRNENKVSYENTLRDMNQYEPKKHFCSWQRPLVTELHQIWCVPLGTYVVIVYQI